jgi:thioesterase domain-containing protein/aryl carrier-like protein
MATLDAAAMVRETDIVLEFPATLAQRHLWLKARADGPDPTLNVAARWHIEGSIDLPLLDGAWQRLVDRHETLRTRFVERGGNLIQQVLPSAPFAVRHVDLRHLPEERRAEAAERLAREEAATPFPTMAPPLLRITILQLEDRRADMLLTTHHLVGDCWSNLLLVRELCEICAAAAAGRSPELPQIAMQFGDYAAWQEAWLTEGGAAAADAYWAGRLAGLQPFAVPVDRAPPAAPTRRGDIVGRLVPPATMERVLAAARDRGATFFAFGLAGLVATLHRWTGGRDILVTTQVAGRQELELEAIAGPFINTIALRSDCAGDPAFAALLDQVLGTVGEALEHGAAPFERLLAAGPPAAHGRRGALEGVNFQVLNAAFLKDSDAGSFALRGFPSVSPGAKRDLDVYLVERAAGWRLQCEYDPDLFDRDDVAWLLDAYLGVLDAAAAQPGQSLSALPFARRQAPADPAAAPADAEGADRLLGIWRSVLRRDAVAPDDNFFALGGDSLRAAQLLARAEAGFGKRIGLAQLFRAPTPRGMAALFGVAFAGPAALPAPESGTAEDWRVVTLRAEGTGTPVIGINNVAVLHALSALPGIDRPLIGLRLFEPGRPHDLGGQGYEAIAARTVALLRQVRPHGPYILFGECVHASLTYAVAQHLTRQGETVELLIGCNMWHPAYGATLGRVARWRTRFADAAASFAEWRSGRRSLLGALGTYALPHRLGLFAAAKRLGLIRAIPPRAGLPEDQEDALLRLLDARRGYVPPPYDGAVLMLVKPDAAATPGFRPGLGWDGLLLGPVTTRAVRDVAVPEAAHPGLPGIAETIAALLKPPRQRAG